METNHETYTLILGATGDLRTRLIQEFSPERTGTKLRIAAPRTKECENLTETGVEAIRIDCSDPSSFDTAVADVDRIVLVTDPSVALLTQGKMVVDAAKNAQIQHLIHIGLYDLWNTTDSRSARHHLIAKHISLSGIAWTHLYRNDFFSFVTSVLTKSTNTRQPSNPDKFGISAIHELASTAAAIFRGGPKEHAGQTYVLADDLDQGERLTTVLLDVSDAEYRGVPLTLRY